MSVNIQGDFGILMAGKILDGLYVYPGEKQMRDIGVAKNMGCYLKVNGIEEIPVCSLLTLLRHNCIGFPLPIFDFLYRTLANRPALHGHP